MTNLTFYSHIREAPNGETAAQTVAEHLIGTAERAAECLRSVGLENAGYLAGLLNDIGK